MSSWVWMEDAKDLAGSFADPPMKHVNDRDKRKSVKELISKHRGDIDKVKAALLEDVESKKLYDPSKHDDLWCVRFVLSHKRNLKASIKAAKHTLQFRAEHKLDEKDIRFVPLDRNTPNELIQQYFGYCTDDTISFHVPDPKRGVVSFMNMGGMDQHAIVKNLDESAWPVMFRYATEWQFQWNDYVTRTTGLLTKTARIVDMQEFAFGKMNMECSKRDSKAMASMEDTYPQMLSSMYFCHSPAWVQVPWRIMRPLLPKRFVEKCDFINPDHKRKEMERLLDYVNEDNLPKRFGGKYTPWPVEYPLPSKTG